jgi:UDP-N-acetylmuramoyl-tripeptide--D-alanyl-D-alanine ligase
VTRTLAGFARDAAGTLVGEDRAYASVSTDSRSIGAGDLFVALRGPNFDGAAFIPQCRTAGATGVVAREPVPGFSTVVVDDTLRALQRAASAWRGRFAIPLVGVAGSNGKTTCKEMIASILTQAGPTLSTRGNLNNHIGVPLTLLRLDPAHRFAVVELGANRAGDVAELAGLAAPGIGIVTNAGAEHLEGFGSLEGVARAEGELFAALGNEAVAVVNVDDPYAGLWRAMTRARIVGFGTSPAADFRAVDLRAGVDARGFVTRFRLECPAGAADVEMRLAGLHNVVNAAGAAAAAVAAGATLDHVVAGLAGMRAVPGRLAFRQGIAGAWVIDDSYNANPSSMHAGIDVLAGLDGRRWIAIGDMAELGPHAAEAHAELGRYARQRGVERVFAIGELCRLAVEAFGAGARWFPDAAAMADALRVELAPDVRVLVKGSRFNRLERVVEAIAVAGGAGEG